MRCIRIVSSYLLACLSLILFLHASSIAPVNAANQKSNLIRVWTVGSPHTGALPRAVVPPGLRQRAEKLGYTIEVETFRASGFAAKFREALQNHNEPEILTFDNYGVIRGVQTQNGWVEGVDADRQVGSSLVLVHETLSALQQRGGWVMLVRSAVNYQAARALSMPPAECESQFVTTNSPAIGLALRQAREKAEIATLAYLNCDWATLSGLSDESRLVQHCFMPKSDINVEAVKGCTVSGNNKLAFVSLVTSFSAKVREPDMTNRSRQAMDLGQQSILAVLRNQKGTWRVLAITDDPMNTVARIPLTDTNGFLKLLDPERLDEITPEPARLITADGVYPTPYQKGERFGDFIWQPSQSTDVIGQVFEFTLGNTLIGE